MSEKSRFRWFLDQGRCLVILNAGQMIGRMYAEVSTEKAEGDLVLAIEAGHQKHRFLRHIRALRDAMKDRASPRRMFPTVPALHFCQRQPGTFRQVQ
jgi:hypothetical protein